MSNAVVPKNVSEIAPQSWTKEQMELITATIARGATPDELKLFLYRAKSLGLDPLKPGQIYFIKYGSNPGTVVVGIEGFRVKAAKTGKLAGVRREVIRDEKGKCVGARCTVHRHDWDHPAIEEVSLSEYDTSRGNWKTMPETMIKKVAEAAALRMAFPDDLGGVYAEEEMEKVSRKVPGGTPEQPQLEDGIQEDGVEIPYGPLAKKLVHRADPAALAAYVQSIITKSETLKKPIPIWAEPVIEAAAPIIARFEREQAERLRGNVEDDVPFDESESRRK